jgi:hypothetical protein
MDLTPFRIRVGLGILAGVIAFIGILIIFSVGTFYGDTVMDGDKVALFEKVKSLEEELRKKELALAVQAKRLTERNDTKTVASVPSGPSEDVTGPTDREQPATNEERGAAPPPESPLSGQVTPPPVALHEESQDTQSDSPKSSDTVKSSDAEKSEPPSALHAGGPVPAEKSGVINFNAQKVTAVAERPDRGILSFRLIKDTPKTKFSGYLFVFVEMEDRRGENKIFVYPQRTQLGEGDLPKNFKDGENIEFKFNSRVELPYKDTRPGATLTRISILLYGENGNIVFQRGFEGRDLNKISKTATNGNNMQAKPATRRRSL